MKYIVVTGGVLSGIGKGIIASSTAMILKSMGLRVTSIKIDPYLNIDAGTMSPFEHGEVFVLDDGGEVDLDLGNYERFLDVNLGKDNNITTGKIYNLVIEKERKGQYLGKTVQVVPHITEEIQNWIERVAHLPVDGDKGTPDVCVIELGGTVGDIESMPFTEALRQFQFRVGVENFCLMHVSLVPVLGVVGEQKTKPSQQSIRELRSLGLSPDFCLCRSTQPLTEETKKKISLFCHVAPDNVIGVHDVSNIYRVPILLNQQNLPNLVLRRLQLNPKVDLSKTSPSESTPYWMASWKGLADRMDKITNESLNPIRIAMVGKYTGLTDAYLSVIKALDHASMAIERKMVIDWVEASNLETQNSSTAEYKKSWEMLRGAHGILVPGGFGDRGIEGMILTANYARTSGKPFLGICLGLQIAVIEYARNVMGWENANSEEFSASGSGKNVVVFMPEVSKTHMGGTMRLGSRDTIFTDVDNKISKLYNVDKVGQAVEERHRHRYEVNPEVVDEIHAKGLHFVGKDTTGVRMEIVELKDHDYYVACQFHPEFKSRPQRPSPPFIGLLNASLERLKKM
ncbi:CTP synthase [Dictyostelium discoideum AX4]|uniref:CTP synthase n=1 Tax=Dictyostelium discoideum TaxID=44689 RepID=PYRG_DICDI|nr:CTP synthase [Dictyostelium discoideum AX4]Q54V77.1 RecName: Full=CTP synthase; AltName: Full=CTP synthetase; AltName: Full=UTP--ammonia ligase [Dictyostelium discoideum]EAL67085.1 CTP synthase [Dictyostelium discoideum AX4]|eukprot:XP_641054.1 CTP synthase [Dictyostelium discoideum AX4]